MKHQKKIQLTKKGWESILTDIVKDQTFFRSKVACVPERQNTFFSIKSVNPFL
jgi:hypothetical protein